MREYIINGLSFVGCLYNIFKAIAIKDPPKITTYDKGIAACVEKKNTKIKIGTIMAPPPIPPALERAANTIIISEPTISGHYIIKRSLCVHLPSSHELKSLQSESTSQLSFIYFYLYS